MIKIRPLFFLFFIFVIISQCNPSQGLDVKKIINITFLYMEWESEEKGMSIVISNKKKMKSCLERDFAKRIPEFLPSIGRDIGEFNKWVESVDLKTYKRDLMLFEHLSYDKNVGVLLNTGTDCFTSIPIYE